MLCLLQERAEVPESIQSSHGSLLTGGTSQSQSSGEPAGDDDGASSIARGRRMLPANRRFPPVWYPHRLPHRQSGTGTMTKVPFDCWRPDCRQDDRASFTPLLGLYISSVNILSKIRIHLLSHTHTKYIFVRTYYVHIFFCF
jgi:hypothetical protein